ncbi:MAG: DUF5802 family protein [Halobacteria archaeon]|nr:DUF5802 family protein [Halobacteria archaeon]
MFEDFSSGYYLGRLYVEPYDGDDVVIQRKQYEVVNQEIYDGGEHPLVMKIDTRHFPVHADEGVPNNTVALPNRFIDPNETSDLPALKEVLLAKPERATQILRYLNEVEEGY